MSFKNIPYTDPKNEDVLDINVSILAIPEKIDLDDFLTIIEEWNVKAHSIVVSDKSQISDMKQAREARLFLVKKRTGLENKRKEILAPYKNFTESINERCKKITTSLKEIEEYLLEQETFAERAEKQEREERRQERIKALAQFNVDINYYDIDNMSDDMFESCIEKEKRVYETLKNTPKIDPPMPNTQIPQTHSLNPDKPILEAFISSLPIISVPKVQTQEAQNLLNVFIRATAFAKVNLEQGVEKL